MVRPIFKKEAGLYYYTGKGLYNGRVVTSVNGQALPKASNQPATKKDFQDANGITLKTKNQSIMKTVKPKGTTESNYSKIIAAQNKMIAQMQKNNGLLAGQKLITSNSSCTEIPITLTLTVASDAAADGLMVLGDAMGFIRTAKEQKTGVVIGGTHATNTVNFFNDKAKYQKCYFEYLQISAYAADGTTPKPSYFNGSNVSHAISDDLANVNSYPLPLFKGLNSSAMSPELREFKDHAFAFLAQNAMLFKVPKDTHIEVNMILKINENAFIGESVTGKSC